MTPTLATLEIEALKLSREERALLADHLLASLSSDQEIDDAWAVEVERRLREVEKGDVSMVPAEQAIARARQSIA